MALFAGPTKRTRASGFDAVAETVGGIRRGRQAFTRGVQANLRDIRGGRTSDLRSVTQSRTADVAQAASAGGPTTTLGSATDQAIGRARGLSRVVNATKSEFDQSLLQERIAVVREGQRQQGQGLAVLSQVGQLQDNLAGSQQVLDEQRENNRLEAAGTVVGFGAERFSSFFTGRSGDAAKIAAKNKGAANRIANKNAKVGGTGAGMGAFTNAGPSFV